MGKLTGSREKRTTPSGIILFFLLLIFLGVSFMITFIFGCPYLTLTHLPCPGCGMTRAFLSVLRLDFYQAFQYHPMFVPLLLFPVSYVLYMVWHAGKRHWLKRAAPAEPHTSQGQDSDHGQNSSHGQRLHQSPYLNQRQHFWQTLGHDTAKFCNTKFFYALIGLIFIGYIVVYLIRIIFPLLTHGDPYYLFLLRGDL